MKPDMHIVWLMPDASLTVTSLGDVPQAGIYQDNETTVIVQISESGYSVSAVNSIAELDAKVSAGLATFTPVETDDQYMDRIAAHARSSGAIGAGAKRMPNVTGEHYRSLDQKFFNAFTWTTPEPVIDVCMVKAREIHKNMLRELRAPKLAALDVEYMRAHEAGDVAALADIAKRKQVLRDVTKHSDAAANTEQLNIPDALQ